MDEKGEVALDQQVKQGRPRPLRLNVYKGWCKRCGICIAFCPKEALERDDEGYPRWKEPSPCIGCGMCELRCPDFAIEVVVEETQEEGSDS